MTNEAFPKSLIEQFYFLGKTWNPQHSELHSLREQEIVLMRKLGGLQVSKENINKLCLDVQCYTSIIFLVSQFIYLLTYSTCGLSWNISQWSFILMGTLLSPKALVTSLFYLSRLYIFQCLNVWFFKYVNFRTSLYTTLEKYCVLFKMKKGI